MKPYYQDDAVTLYHGDCREIVPQLGLFTLVFTSPPYNQNLQAFKPSGMHKETNWVKRISSSYYDTMDEPEYQREQIELLDICHDRATDDGSLFYNHKLRWRDTIPIFPISWLLQTKWKMRQEIVWARDGSVTQNAKMFPPSDERIYWMRNKSFKWARANPTWMSVWKISSDADTPHPVAFPIELPTRAIVSVTEEGDSVLDPFAGSGTTGRAAKDLGRKCTLIEREERYCEIAARRMAQEVFRL